jgi:hypothetical protein
MSAIQAQFVLDTKIVLGMADDFNHYIWVVGINETEHLFYTSDHPVVRRGNMTIGDRLGIGVRDPGVEFVFPLDSKHILLRR